MTRKLFGTDGIRGTANKYPMTCEVALNVGRAVARIFKKSNAAGIKNKIVLGRDTRISGQMLENAVASGICSEGVDVIKVGILTTPDLAFITKEEKALAGIMISASHNPYEDNGIKIFAKGGLKLSDELEGEIENLIFNFLDKSEGEESNVISYEIGQVYNLDANSDYVTHIKNAFPGNLNLHGIKLVVDCANGAGYLVAPEIFKKLGAEVVVINDKPNGININLNCGATDTKMLSKVVVSTSADIGIALDGDADRLIVVDEKGSLIDGDNIMTLCAADLKNRKKLKKDTVVVTVMSNMGLDIAMNNSGINVVKTDVGDRYVLEEMQKNDYNFGGEQSGHLIFLDHATTGDGILSAAMVLAIMKKSGKKISELGRVMKKLPQVLINVKIKRKENINSIPGIRDEIIKSEKELLGMGRILVRFSGTENLCRVMVEAPTHEISERIARKVADAVELNLN